MLSQHVVRYVALHRQLGLRYNEQERILGLFAAYVQASGDRYITIGRIQSWCATASTPNRARTWFDTVRRFSLFLNAEDARHEALPAGAFGRGRRPRPAPHILGPDQVSAIMQAALQISPQGTISPYTYHYVFGLLATTGMRVSEALGLKRHDLVEDGLIVRKGKFDNCRLVPLHASTRRALNDYIAIRDEVDGDSDDLFVVTTGRAPTKTRVHVVFVRLARQLGIRGPKGTRGARLHDLRHTFAVRSLEACEHDREAVGHHTAALSAYLGHADVEATYWYLQATPVLMHDIAAAAEQLFHGEAA
jgi:integrase/recombinase XerD